MALISFGLWQRQVWRRCVDPRNFDSHRQPYVPSGRCDAARIQFSLRRRNLDSDRGEPERTRHGVCCLRSHAAWHHLGASARIAGRSNRTHQGQISGDPARVRRHFDHAARESDGQPGQHDARAALHRWVSAVPRLHQRSKSFAGTLGGTREGVRDSRSAGSKPRSAISANAGGEFVAGGAGLRVRHFAGVLAEPLRGFTAAVQYRIAIGDERDADGRARFTFCIGDFFVRRPRSLPPFPR